MSFKQHLTIFLLFFSVFALTGQGSIQSSDGKIMFLLTASLVERQSLMIAEPDNAPGLPTYSKYGIGMSILAIPFYLIGKILSMVMGIDPAMATQFCVSMINAFLSAGTCLLVYRFARERLWFSPKTALALAVAYGFSTMAWFYSEDFMSEPAATLLILLAVWWITGASAGSSHGFYWGAGIFLGLAVLCRLNSLIVIPGFVLYCFLIAHNPSIKNFQTWVGDLMRLLVPVALCILLICIYNYARFGDFLETGYESGFGSGFLTGFLGILFSPGKSIFLYNPMIILGLLAVPQFCRKQKPVFVLFAWIVGVHLLLFSFWHSWYGGMGWGPRLMVVTLPFLILPMGFCWNSMQENG